MKNCLFVMTVVRAMGIKKKKNFNQTKAKYKIGGKCHYSKKKKKKSNAKSPWFGTALMGHSQLKMASRAGRKGEPLPHAARVQKAQLRCQDRLGLEGSKNPKKITKDAM